jgi:multiple sugar transport system substrate-binding protein
MTKQRVGALRWSAVLLISLLTLPLAAAAAELAVWYPAIDWANPKVMEQYFREFSDSTGIRIQGYPTAWGDLHQKIKVAVAGGAGPDVAIVNRQAILTWAIVDRFLAPLEGALGPDFRRADYIDPTITEVLFKGRLYGVPFDFQLRGMFWNKRLFAEAGLPVDQPPQVLDDLVAYDRRLTRVGSDGALERLGFYPDFDNWYAYGWIWTFGGDIFDWKTGEVAIDTPRNQQVYEWFESWGQRHPFGSVTSLLAACGSAGDSMGAFRKDRLGIMMHAATYITNIRRDLPDLEFGTGRVPLPPGGRNGLWAGGLGVVMPIGSREPQAAGKLIRFLTSHEVQRRWFQATERFPAHRRALVSVPVKDPEMRAIVVQSEEQVPKPPLFELFGPPLGNARTQVLRLQTTPAQALFDAQKTVAGRFAEVNFAEAWQGM